MLDLARVVALLCALAGCRRPHYVLGALASLAIAVLLAWEIGDPLANHATGEGGFGSAFALAFLGPSRIAPRTWVTLVEGALAAGASSVAFRRARPLRPEVEAARAWDAAGLHFLLVATMDALLVVFDLLLARLMRDG